MVVYNKEFKSEKSVRDIDQFLIGGSESDVSYDGSSKTPRNTWHVRFFRYGFVVFIRKSETSNRGASERYIVYGTKTAIDTVLKKVDTNITLTEVVVDSSIQIFEFESAVPWSSSFNGRMIQLPSDNPFPGQEMAVNALVSAYQTSLKTTKKRLSALLIGEPGTGKSNIALFLAKKINASVVYGYDLTAPGQSLNELWKLAPSADKPVILVLDEIDVSYATADRNEQPKEFRCLAQTKTSLNGLFDRFERTDYLIVIGTTNLSFEVLSAKYPSYIRKGRADVRGVVTRDGFTTV